MKIKELRQFPQDAHLEVINGKLTIVTLNKYSGRYVFDPESRVLPNFSRPDEEVYESEEDLP